ncbi:non-hydrolyzing UDP-N-acetylglucosamine 2-epimerase [Brevibacterium moorei]|uniref:non-hydrolyzing UDP-N-acetylglucosamine 2-epimerase n=1 Tax=Brevibacterium moorei TaxID=2968457 RepID=UPI00211C00B6|nr:UDP-N-acetylglucosamine 2-epimerase (non-hydrolyzing) [Brevibacterium sp. 68QC2CO]MCQ9386237.1 UDP-N-acetylglucosamine 2-epimerase (non-hydrolyzing) [Brevibacterium sp. 68QC2CO]
MAVYGTRPEAIKLAPVIKAIEDADDMESIVVDTGQHREMVEQVNRAFDILPDYELSIMAPGQSLNRIVSKVVEGVDPILESERPDAVLVQGDTSTVMATAVAAFNRQIPVVHLEAGLRTGDLKSPFPEEANRRMTAQVTSLHLAPTANARENLLQENISDSQIVVTGNSVIDALMVATTRFDVQFHDECLAYLAQDRAEGVAGPVILVTSHRRENQGPAMRGIGLAVADLARKFPAATFVLPLHRNPKVRKAIKPAVEGLQNVLVVEPLDYPEFTAMLSLSDIVLTDSGGVQEEAPSLGKPVLVMRENTERPEAVAAGTVKLIGTDRDRLVHEVSVLLEDHDAYASMANAVNPYGDGLASTRALEAMRWMFDAGVRPADFDTDTESILPAAESASIAQEIF